MTNEFFNFVIGFYNNILDTGVCLVGDNCNVNKTLAADMRASLIGCASHRYNFSVCDIFKDNEDYLSMVRSIMVIFQTVTAAETLREVTHFRAFLDKND